MRSLTRAHVRIRLLFPCSSYSTTTLLLLKRHPSHPIWNTIMCFRLWVRAGFGYNAPWWLENKIVGNLKGEKRKGKKRGD